MRRVCLLNFALTRKFQRQTNTLCQLWRTRTDRILQTTIDLRNPSKNEIASYTPLFRFCAMGPFYSETSVDRIRK